MNLCGRLHRWLLVDSTIKTATDSAKYIEYQHSAFSSTLTNPSSMKLASRVYTPTQVLIKYANVWESLDAMIFQVFWFRNSPSNKQLRIQLQVAEETSYLYIKCAQCLKTTKVTRIISWHVNTLLWLFKNLQGNARFNTKFLPSHLLRALTLENITNETNAIL